MELPQKRPVSFYGGTLSAGNNRAKYKSFLLCMICVFFAVSFLFAAFDLHETHDFTFFSFCPLKLK